MQDDNPKIQGLRENIELWLNRAAMAYCQGNSELSKVALQRRFDLQKQLANLERTEAPRPPEEPEVFFRELKPPRPPEFGQGGGFFQGPRRPDQPAPVPRRPKPHGSSAEIALPEPSPD